MGDKRRGGKRRADEETQKLSKEDDAIARLVRFNCPTKTTMFEGNEVHYFSGSKAVDVLFESKQYGHEAKEVKFSTRSSAVAMMRSLLEQGLFFRARKLVAKRKEDKRDKDKGEVEKSPKRKPKKEEKIEKEAKDRKEKKKEKAKDSDANDEDEEKEKKKDKDEDEKKKRKVKLELHQDQSFNDTNDVYVWIFDPTPLLKKIIGALMVLGTIVGCLFPLWPMWLRQGVYYMSLVALGCFGVLIGVAIARTILFALIWACTMGRHKLWLLPNLTEDCGFFESFKPWYTYEYVSDETASTKKKKKTDTKKTDDNSDKSDSKEKSGEEGEHKSEEESSNEKDQVHLREKKQRAPEESVDSEEGSASEEEDEQSSQGSGVSEDIEHNNTTEENKKPRRRARKDNDDFVLVEKQ